MARQIITGMVLIGLAIFAACEPYTAATKNQNDANNSAIPSLAKNDTGGSKQQAQSTAQNPPKWCAALENPEVWLVFVGILTFIGICVQANEMRRATREMKYSTDQVTRQANEMEKQTPILRDNVKAAMDNAASAKDNAEAANKNIEMFISKERARIRIEPIKVEIPQPGLISNIQNPIIYYKIFCHGTTEAVILESCARIKITENTDSPDIDYSVPIRELPSVMTTNVQGLDCVNFAFDRPDVAIAAVASGLIDRSMFLHFWGFISYRTVFDNKIHRTKFRYIYGIKETYFLLVQPVSAEWWKTEKIEDNQET